jgi:hypothetical protein
LGLFGSAFGSAAASAGASAEGAAGRGSFGFSAARSATALGFLPFGEGAAGLAVSRCNMFFKPLRSDFGRFSAMRALGKNVTPFYYNGIAQEE